MENKIIRNIYICPILSHSQVTADSEVITLIICNDTELIY